MYSKSLVGDSEHDLAPEGGLTLQGHLPALLLDQAAPMLAHKSQNALLQVRRGVANTEQQKIRPVGPGDRVGIKKTHPKNPPKNPLKMFFFLIFYENNTNFSL